MDLLKKIHELKCKMFGHAYIYTGILEREVDEDINDEYQRVAIYSTRRCIVCGEALRETPTYQIRKKPKMCTCIKEVYNFKENKMYEIFGNGEDRKQTVLVDELGIIAYFEQDIFNHFFKED
ncbi:hypothetical protein [uncultured Clostridium sp.]|uniref:hypothetical protein n=1 Tax=uncultured Clostridium sp. TaxID=59620 RepID=UPI00261F97EA|nr:hypothetical protein [uncultured Clostridium sp.]